MSRIAELAQNIGISESQYREYKVSGIKEEEYKKLIKDKGDETLLSESELKELRNIVDKNEEYTILDFIRERKPKENKSKANTRKSSKKAKKEEVKLDKIELTEEDIECQKLLMEKLGLEAELKEEDFDRATIKIKSKLYDKVLYTAHTLNKDVSTVINDILEKSLSGIPVNEERVAQIRENNKKRRIGSSK